MEGHLTPAKIPSPPTLRSRAQLAALAMGLLASLLVRSLAQGAPAEPVPLPEFDLTREAEAGAWGRPHDIRQLQATADGLAIEVSGRDPYLFGPARDYPADTPLWLNLRLKSNQAGSAEIFYFRDQPRSGDSVQGHVPAGRWVDLRLPLPPLGQGTRLRFDPPGADGAVVVLASIKLEKRLSLAAPVWPPWAPPGATTRRAVDAGTIELLYGDESPLGVEVKVSGNSMAFAHPRPRIAYVHGDQVRWLDLANGTTAVSSPGTNQTILTTRIKDPDGAEWRYQQAFREEGSGTIAINTEVTTSHDRAAAFVPMHLFIAGERSFGRRKSQGLLAGLEYLGDEPSSSEADIEGPEANRRVPARHKITFPLMAIQDSERYIGLIWEDPFQFAACFDSPDRTFRSGGHLLGVLFPGSDGQNREEGSLMPYAPMPLKAGKPVRSKAWIIGGRGASIADAAQHYIRLRGWPSRPDPGMTFQDYIRLAAHGWLKSRVREGNLYRHAYWPGFEAQPAADAAVWQLWLARHSDDPALTRLLEQSAKQAIAAVPPSAYLSSAIGHVRPPLAPLIYGNLPEALEAARRRGQAELARFATDGSLPYRPASRGVNYGRTHGAPDANGHTAAAVATVLEAAAFSGDPRLIHEGLANLRALDRFRHSVPRGAQTWEVPLHTPDILAAAHLVRAWVLGYELSGDPESLTHAKEWAWTGIPFVYLTNPTRQRVGPYSTIAVFGATSWKAPVWFGRPVQWCGLVYAEALFQLAAHDPKGPWQSLAESIAAAALQQCWDMNDSERAGLLPDYFELREQLSAGPAINPATVASAAARLFQGAQPYSFKALPVSHLQIHYPGSIQVIQDSIQKVRLRVKGWPATPHQLLITGLNGSPAIRIAGQPAKTNPNSPVGTVALPMIPGAEVEVECEWPDH